MTLQLSTALDAQRKINLSANNVRRGMRFSLMVQFVLKLITVNMEIKQLLTVLHVMLLMNTFVRHVTMTLILSTNCVSPKNPSKQD